MSTVARRLIVLFTVSVGLTAATAGPAAAGVNFGNHCEPMPQPASAR